jgi:hypothetical protein
VLIELIDMQRVGVATASSARLKRGHTCLTVDL